MDTKLIKAAISRTLVIAIIVLIVLAGIGIGIYYSTY